MDAAVDQWVEQPLKKTINIRRGNAKFYPFYCLRKNRSSGLNDLIIDALKVLARFLAICVLPDQVVIHCSFSGLMVSNSRF